MAKYKVVMLDSLLPITDIERDILAKADASVQQVDVMTPDEIEKAAADADGVMAIGVPLTAEAQGRLKKCKVIGRYGIGLNTVDLDAATAKGIVVTYAPVYCQDEVAALALCLMLACERRLIQADNVVKGGNWKKSVATAGAARSILGKTFGFVGFGSIAQKLAPLVAPLGVKMIAYDPYINLDACKKLGVIAMKFEEVLKNADYISLHVPLTSATEHMIGEDQFKMMRKDAILINTARGGLVDQKALTKALQNGEIAAAGIDVLEKEPPDADDPIFTLPNIITSGHIGAGTIESVERLRAIVAQGVADVLSGKWPKFPGNPDVKEKVNLA